MRLLLSDYGSASLGDLFLERSSFVLRAKHSSLDLMDRFLLSFRPPIYHPKECQHWLIRPTELARLILLDDTDG